MNAASALVNGWLLPTSMGGGFLLLVTWAVMRCLHQPARQQRVGEWGLVAALLAAGLVLAPSWLHVPLVGGISASSTVTPAVDSTGSPNRATAERGEESAMPPVDSQGREASAMALTTPTSPADGKSMAYWLPMAPRHMPLPGAPSA